MSDDKLFFRLLFDISDFCIELVEYNTVSNLSDHSKMSTRDIGNEPDLGYADIMERALTGEEKRRRERLLMDEGTSLWRQKKQVELDQEIRDQYEVRFIC